MTSNVLLVSLCFLFFHSYKLFTKSCIHIDEEDEEENQDLISDAWGDDVMTATEDTMEINDGHNLHDSILTKEKLTEIMQKSRSLIRMARRSQILTRFINSCKKALGITEQLTND